MPDSAFQAQGVKQICKLAESRISMSGFVTQYYPVNASNSGSSNQGKPVVKPNPGASAAEQMFYFELCNLLDSYQWNFVKKLGLAIYDTDAQEVMLTACCERCKIYAHYYNCCCEVRKSWIIDVGKMPRYPSYFVEVLICQLAYRLAQAQGSVSTMNTTLNEKNRALSKAKAVDAHSCCQHLYYEYRPYAY